MKPSNVTRMLQARKIPFKAFELPEEKLGALEAARILGTSAEQVFKTIVVRREGKGKPILAVVAGTREVDLKLLAKALGEKKLHLPTEREAERITGLQAGGISALALLNRGIQVVLDVSSYQWKEIYVSGGQRGMDILLPVKDFVGLTGASIAEITR